MNNRILITGDFDIPPAYNSSRLVHLRTPVSNNDIINHLAQVQHYIVGGPEYVNEEIISAAHHLKHIVVMGTGTNSFVDMAAAQRHGIQVNNTPGINANAVAEFALGSVIFNLANSVHSRDGLLRGAWYQKPHKTLSEVSMGIIGLGDIGSRLASKIRAVSPETQILYHSRTPKPEKEQAHRLEFRPLEMLVQESDIIVMCVTYSETTHQIINEKLLEKAKNGIMIFNFSKPETIAPKALSDALTSGKVSFAYYDGYYDEWIYNQGQDHDRHGLLKFGPDKFVATSHIAAQSDKTIEAIIHEAFSKIESWHLREGTFISNQIFQP